MNDAFDVIEGDVLIEGGRIRSVAGRIGPPPPGTVAIDAAGDYLLPGFVQTHVHLCQTLFRGYADDLALLDWLRTRIWPLEAAHTPASLRAATRAGRGRTAAGRHDQRADDGDRARHGCGVRGAGADRAEGRRRQVHDGRRRRRCRAGCSSRRRRPLTRASRWPARWHGRAERPLARGPGAALRGVLLARSPRGGRPVVPRRTDCWCTRMRRRTGTRSRSCGQRTGLANIAYLAEVGLVDQHVCLAHCVWVDEGEQPTAGRAAGSRAALPGIQPQARVGHRTGGRVARARRVPSRWAPTARRATTTSTCSRRCGWRPPYRRCGSGPDAARARGAGHGHPRRRPSTGTWPRRSAR